MTYQQWLESSGCCGLQDARQQRRGGARAEATHRTQAKQRGGQVTTKGHRQIHTPPLPQATWGQHQAQRQQLCWLQNREGTQRTERKGKTANLFLGSTPPIT